MKSGGGALQRLWGAVPRVLSRGTQENKYILCLRPPAEQFSPRVGGVRWKHFAFFVGNCWSRKTTAYIYYLHDFISDIPAEIPSGLFPREEPIPT